MDARVVTICRNEKNHTRLRVWLDSLVEAAAIEPIEFNQLFQMVTFGFIYGYTFSYTFF